MSFDIEKTVSYWKEGAEYDKGVAEVLFQTGKYPYALFIGHLALEKLLKALVVKNAKTHAAFTHSLPLLAQKAMLTIPEEFLVKLREFMEFHFEARYPREQRAFYTKCTKAYTTEKFNEILQVYQWLKNQF